MIFISGTFLVLVLFCGPCLPDLRLGNLGNPAEFHRIQVGNSYGKPLDSRDFPWNLPCYCMWYSYGNFIMGKILMEKPWEFPQTSLFYCFPPFSPKFPCRWEFLRNSHGTFWSGGYVLYSYFNRVLYVPLCVQSLCCVVHLTL